MWPLQMRMTPVTTATNTPGKPIKIGAIPAAIAITPDGKTAYIADVHPGTVTPVATATNTPGRPIKIGGFPWAIAITPDGKTAYIVNLPAYGRGPSRVIPVATATNTPGRPIKISDIVGLSAAIAITPDGKTAYIASGGHPGTVTPIATATKRRASRSGRRASPGDIAITPDGKTAYVASGARRHGDPDQHRHQHARQADHGRRYRPTRLIAITPDGKTAYVADWPPARSSRSAPPPTRRASRSDRAGTPVGRSRSRRTGRPPTSPPLPTSPGVAPGAQLVR